MSLLKNFIKSTIIGSLILVPILIFIYFTQGYVSNYNFVIGSVGYFIDTMQNMVGSGLLFEERRDHSLS